MYHVRMPALSDVWRVAWRLRGAAVVMHHACIMHHSAPEAAHVRVRVQVPCYIIYHRDDALS
jgi:hypothetical protein